MIDSMLRKLEEIKHGGYFVNMSWSDIKGLIESARPSERELMGRVDRLEKALSYGLSCALCMKNNVNVRSQDLVRVLEEMTVVYESKPSGCKHRYNPALSGCCLDCGYNPNPCPDSLWMQHSEDCRCKACSIIKKVLNDKPNPSESDAVKVHNQSLNMFPNPSESNLTAESQKFWKGDGYSTGLLPKTCICYSNSAHANDRECTCLCHGPRNTSEPENPDMSVKCPKCKQPYAKCGCSLGADVKEPKIVEDDITVMIYEGVREDVAGWTNIDDKRNNARRLAQDILTRIRRSNPECKHDGEYSYKNETTGYCHDCGKKFLIGADMVMIPRKLAEDYLERYPGSSAQAFQGAIRTALKESVQ